MTGAERARARRLRLEAAHEGHTVGLEYDLAVWPRVTCSCGDVFTDKRERVEHFAAVVAARLAAAYRLGPAAVDVAARMLPDWDGSLHDLATVASGVAQ